MKPENPAAILFVLSMFVFTTPDLANAVNYTQYTELWKESETGGGIDKVVVTKNTPDLSKIDFEDPDQACLNGVWIFYEHCNYNPDGSGGREHYFSSSGDCVSLDQSAGITSMRYAGVQTDFSVASFTFYEHNYFQGRIQFTVTESTKELNKSGKSFIITGSECWSVYGERDDKGHRACIPPENSDGMSPTFFRTLDDHNKTIPDYIEFIEMGCTCD